MGWAHAAAKAEEANQEPAPRVTLSTTAGELTIELYPDKAPATVANFLDLVESGFYEGLVFHRVIAGFMIQTGGYDGALEYRTPPRQVVNESSNGLANRRWSVAMARHADPDSAGSQFYINLFDNQHLDATAEAPGYTVFGQLVAGFDVAEDIELTDTGTRGGMADVPVTHIVVQNARRVE
ncbi:MAG: peptidylprolyl isomerase [Gammaproteobacteria bacterium]|nr:peptidylprolyl isomerase [Gammaproteobacteria bacterium]MYB36418.1 peptidylprolyl isomerase [Gammaproteobacteria bacterium]